MHAYIFVYVYVYNYIHAYKYIYVYIYIYMFVQKKKEKKKKRTRRRLVDPVAKFLWGFYGPAVRQRKEKCFFDNSFLSLCVFLYAASLSLSYPL